MQNHHCEKELVEFVDAMDKWTPIVAACGSMATLLIVGLIACYQLYGAHVAIAVALLLMPFLLIVTGFVWARNQKPRADNT